MSKVIPFPRRLRPVDRCSTHNALRREVMSCIGRSTAPLAEAELTPDGIFVRVPFASARITSAQARSLAYVLLDIANESDLRKETK